jgi:hypothetical protein
MAVWEDHLLPLLTLEGAARLGCTCKALRGVVREHVKDLGGLALEKLQAALTTFPNARKVYAYPSRVSWGAAQSEALVEWLREGGHGRGITTLTMSLGDREGNSAIHAALREGALPSLRSVTADLFTAAHREFLTRGPLEAVHELRLHLVCPNALEPQLAALSRVRHLPTLTKLVLEVSPGSPRGDTGVAWPPFIPPSLKALYIVAEDGPTTASLLRGLPGMLGGSGARLIHLQVRLTSDFSTLDDGLVHVAQALRCCSPTLKTFRLSTFTGSMEIDHTAGDFADQEERLRMQWAGVSTCRGLEVLMLPPRLEVEPLFPPGAAFGRLTDLQISDYGQGSPRDAGVVGLWELMASGGLPALTKLKVRIVRMGEEVETRLAPAFGAVADTLTHLHFDRFGDPYLDTYAVNWAGCRAGYELGLAVGKLRRLKELVLEVTDDGRTYHAVAQGLAASGGDRSLPLLWRVILPRVWSHADLVASLLLPSVRVFVSAAHGFSPTALLTACALRQAGYGHTWAIQGAAGEVDAVRAIANCRIGDKSVHERFWRCFEFTHTPRGCV